MDPLERELGEIVNRHFVAARWVRFLDGAPPYRCKEHILIVDDILTSGATTAECARCLLKAGPAL